MTELVRIAAPAIPCGTCGRYDWNWNEDLDRWECRACAIYGRPEPERPTIGFTSADEWCHQVLKEYEDALRVLEDEKGTSDVEGKAVTIMKMARMSRAEKNLAKASIRADAAALVQQLQRSTTKGDVYLDLPEADIKVRLQW